MRLALAVQLLFGSVASAAGFALDTQSGRGTAMASAMTAAVNDPSAVYYNPAGLLLTRGMAAQLGGHVIIPGVSFESRSGETAKVSSTPATPPHVFGALKLSEQVALGLGFFAPFGNTAQWPDGWVGEELITRSQLQTFYLSPSVAFGVHPRVRVGLGLDVVRGTVVQERVIDAVDSQGTARLGGGGWSGGAVAGAQVELLERMLTAGVVYRGGVPLTFDGAVDFTVPKELQGQLVDQAVRAELELPSQWQFGLALVPIERLTVSLDGWYVDWSSLQALRIEFEDPALTRDDPKRWRGVWTVRAGGEYWLGERVALRAGFKWDPSPSPADTLAPNLPDADRTTINLGGGYRFGAFQVDLAYQLTLLGPRESTFAPLPGTYSGAAHVLGVTVSGERRARQP